MSDRNLGHRTGIVFDAFLAGRTADLHPADREEAEAFWTWLGDFDRPAEAPAARRDHRWWIGASAAAMIVAMLGGTLWMVRPDPAEAFTEHYATGHAERRVVRLADGSTVTLAADSQADIAYTRAERRIRLTGGEALFRVAHNAARPFIVQTRHGEVKAVGTAFDVSVATREAEVTVVEGVIRIELPGARGASPADPIEKVARKGERVAFGIATRDGGSVGFIRQAPDMDAESATAWTRGQLVFRGEPLREVVAKINLYSRERVVLTDPRAGSLPVYGIVDQGDTAAIRDLVADPHAVAIEPGNH